jgi:Cd2+/Zn2+-exporting ATPase
MGGAGSAQAMETADVVLMGDDLSQLPFVVWLSRRTKRVIATNIVLALAVKVAVFALAATGLATLWMAIVADVGASLAVILNGLRLRRMQEPQASTQTDLTPELISVNGRDRGASRI